MKFRILEQINEHISEILKNTPLTDVENNLKAIILAIFSKLDLVTREEFDIQKKVLAETRKHLEELESIIKNLKIKD